MSKEGVSSKSLCLQGAGALAILVMAFTAGVGWRRQGWDDDNPVADSLAKMWIVFQPLLFSLIGAEIQVSSNFKDHYNLVSIV